MERYPTMASLNPNVGTRWIPVRERRPVRKDGLSIFIAKVNKKGIITEIDCAVWSIYDRSEKSSNFAGFWPYWMPATEAMKLFPKILKNGDV